MVQGTAIVGCSLFVRRPNRATTAFVFPSIERGLLLLLLLVARSLAQCAQGSHDCRAKQS